MENTTYYCDNDIIIRTMCQQDTYVLIKEELAQGWHVRKDKFQMRLDDMSNGDCISFVAEYKGNVAGYVNLYFDCKWGAFGGLGYPQIVDFAVLKKYRKNGVGSKLLDIAEQIASEQSDMVYLGVGLHSGYGQAQRMYVKRGYVPDGSGVWYGGKVCEQYANCINDDNLNLYFSKKLK